MHSITVQSAFYFGDLVTFDSVGGTGRGRVVGIVVQSDLSLHYIIQLEDRDDVIGGVDPSEMRLAEPTVERRW